MMKIIIRNEGHKLKFHCPLSMIKLFLPLLKKKYDIDIKPLKKSYLKILRQYVKENGHFKIIEINSDDSYVEIYI